MLSAFGLGLSGISRGGVVPKQYDMLLRTSYFSRASEADYTGADKATHTAAIDELRWDYDASTGDLNGALIQAASSPRAADIWDVPTSSFMFNPLEGTLLVEAMTPDTGATSGIVCLSAAASNTDVINIAMSADGGLGFYSAIAGVNSLSGNFYSGAVTANTPFKAAFAYRENDYAWKVTGKTLGTDTAAGVPAVDTLRLGRRDLAATFWNGWLRKVIYVPRRMSNTEITAWAS